MVGSLNFNSEISKTKFTLGESNTKSAEELPPGLIHVQTEQQIISIIQEAKQNRRKVRLTGSYHSAPGVCFGNDTHYKIRLFGDLRKVTVLKKTAIELLVKVGAGCYLGVHPSDSTSTLEHSLNHQLQELGFALPILGGMSHQSVGGFLSTGSAGGSLKFGFADVVTEIHFIDGNGVKHIAKRGTDLFNAVGVSMGLFGVVTHVVFLLQPTYDVKGTEQNVKFRNSVFQADESGKTDLEFTLKNEQYFHADWYPQEGANHVTEWYGSQTICTDIIPYVHILHNKLTQGFAFATLKFLNYLLTFFHGKFSHEIIGKAMDLFTKTDGPAHFCDVWYKTLPNDDQAPVETLFRTEFTEFWFPVEQADNVVKILHEIFKNPQAAGNFATEIYSAKASPFWLSPAFDRDVVRIDPYWFAHNIGDPRVFFTYYWDKLLGVPGVRLHWGKFLPLNGQVCGDTIFNLKFLKGSYHKLEKWLEMRKEYDPHGVFLNDYWRSIFEIET